MANLEVIALDTVTPQLKAPQAGDGYAMPRPVAITGTLGVTGAATATSLALNGATIGTNALAVTGNSALTGSLQLGGNDLILTRKAAASLQLGAADAAAPVAQTIGPQSVVAGTTDTAGANFTIRGSQGTGTGAGGSILFQTAPAGTTGTAQNALVTRATISSTGEVNVPGAFRVGTDTSKGLITYSTNAILFNPSGSQWFSIEHNIVGFSTWVPTGITIGSTSHEGGNLNRAGTPILIKPKGGSGNGIGSYVALYNSLPTASGITGQTQELTIQTWLPATGAAGIQFGGTTSSFPALKRSATIVQFRLADDSAYAPLEASTVRTATAYTVATLPAAGTAGRKAYVTDATAPTFLGALIGGGAVVCPVFDNGTAWVAG